jgi:hypothetical protein
VYNIAWSGHQSNWLLAGTAAGLVGWNVEAAKVKEQGSKYRPMMVDFLLPESDKDNGENPIVDSLAVVGEWSIVAKCALHGLIYLWDLKSTTKSLTEDTKKDKIIEKEVTMLSNLKWSDTDNFYMNLGCHKVRALDYDPTRLGRAWGWWSAATTRARCGSTTCPPWCRPAPSPSSVWWTRPHG